MNCWLMPMPVSSILNSKRATPPVQPSSVAYVFTDPPGLLYLMALLNRLSIICRSRRSLPIRCAWRMFT